MNSESVFRNLKTLIDQRNLSDKTYNSYRAGLKTFCWYFSQEPHKRDHPKNVSENDLIGSGVFWFLPLFISGFTIKIDDWGITSILMCISNLPFLIGQYVGIKIEENWFVLICGLPITIILGLGCISFNNINIISFYVILTEFVGNMFFCCKSIIFYIRRYFK